MLDNGQHSFSSWASTCLLVNKKSDGTHRFCTNYQKLNKITRPYAFSLTRMEDCVDRALFEHLVEAHLTVNLSKREFTQATVKYLCKEVGQGKIRPL